MKATKRNTAFHKKFASKALKRLMTKYGAKYWTPYGNRGARIWKTQFDVDRNEYPIASLTHEDLIEASKNPSISQLQKQYERAKLAYVGGRRTPAHLKKIEKLRKRIEAAELRTLGKRIGHKKNLFGLGRGESRQDVDRKRKSEARKLFEQGRYREARRTARMSTRKYARKKQIPLEGRLRTRLRGAKERARGSVHGVVDRIFGRNSARKNGLGSALIEGVGIGLGISAAEKAVKTLGKKAKENPLPALLSSLGGALEEGVGFAAGSKLLSDVERRKRVKKTKKRSGHRGPARKRKSKRKSKNPARRRPVRVTHAVAIGNRIVSYGSRSQVEHDARILRKAGKKVRIGKRS